MNALLPTLGVAGLVTAYVALAALLLGLNLHSAWSWPLKSGANLLVVALCWVTYTSWPALLGWPVEEDVPELFYLHAALVEEPDRIYFWGTDIERGLGRTVPRAFAVRYTPTLHDRVDKATRKLRKGLPVIGQIVPSEVRPEGPESLEDVRVRESDITFVDAPQSLVPEKN